MVVKLVISVRQEMNQVRHCLEGEINIVLVPLVIGIQGGRILLHLDYDAALVLILAELGSNSEMFCFVSLFEENH